MNALEGIVHNFPEHDYHSHPALSSTKARLLLDSPAKYLYAQTHPQPHKDAFDLGTAVHTKVLGTGYTVATYPPEHLTPSGAASTKAATVAWAEEQRANGVVVISAAQAALVDGMAEAVLAHVTAKKLFEQDGHPEGSVFATDPDTSVDMRARFDYLAPICVDLKTTSKAASNSAFARTVQSFGYDVQQAWYLDTLQIVQGERRPFVFVVVETAAPHLVAVHQLDADYNDMGIAKAKRARQVYAECAALKVWPGYPTEITITIPPMYAVYDFQDNYS